MKPRVFHYNRDSDQANGLVLWYHGHDAQFDSITLNRLRYLTAWGGFFKLGPAAGPPTEMELRTQAGIAEYYQWNDGAGFSEFTSSLSPITISMWVARRELDGVLFYFGNGSWADAVYIGCGVNSAFTKTTAGFASYLSVNTTTPVGIGDWHLFTCVCESDTRMKIYVDGIKEGDATGGPIAGAAPTIMRIGCDFAFGNIAYASIADLRIYRRALSDAEVFAIYSPATRKELWEMPSVRTFYAPMPVTYKDVNSRVVSRSTVKASSSLLRLAPAKIVNRSSLSSVVRRAINAPAKVLGRSTVKVTGSRVAGVSSKVVARSSTATSLSRISSLSAYVFGRSSLKASTDILNTISAFIHGRTSFTALLSSVFGWLRIVSTKSSLRWYVGSSTTVNVMLTDQEVEMTQGDNLRYKHKLLEVPVDVTITKAWLTVKKVLTTDTPVAGTPVPDTQALFQKVITTTIGVDGKIDNAPYKANMFFDVVASESIDYEVGMYEFDIQVLASNGAVYTDVRGTWTILRGVTLDYNN